jgi:GNAT superfamily N-acetyltransferase
MEKPCPLQSEHQVNAFDCGDSSLNIYIQKYALQSQRSHGAVTYVALLDNKVVAYYTLLYGSISREQASGRMVKGLGVYSAIPIIILARLAVDHSMQGKGLAKGLLKDALFRSLSASALAGLRAFVIHAKNDAPRAFYQQYDFQPLPENPLHLYRLISDIGRDLK